jgi:methionyl aminopeptidase
MVEYKTPGEIDAMHAAGQVLARILAAVRHQATPGVRLAELDATAKDVLAQAGATSPFLGYQPAFAGSPYPAVLCASVNDAALHDIPGRRRLKDGDLLSIDCGATLDGWTADAAISVQVGHGAGYGIPADFGGHGIGHALHEDPHIPNAGRPGHGLRLVPGLVIAIEPWFLAGGIDKCRIDPNGWTVRSTDGSHAAHVEHTIAITDNGPVVLTAPGPD